jgi:hypothetical protein
VVAEVEVLLAQKAAVAVRFREHVHSLQQFCHHHKLSHRLTKTILRHTHYWCTSAPVRPLARPPARPVHACLLVPTSSRLCARFARGADSKTFGVNEEDLLSCLPNEIQKKVVREMYKRRLRSISFFGNCENGVRGPLAPAPLRQAAPAHRARSVHRRPVRRRGAASRAGGGHYHPPGPDRQ